MTSTPSTPGAEGTGPAPSSRKTILVVDDQTVLRTILSHALGQQGYQVLTAVDGLDALKMIIAYPGTIDVLITDVMMPVMDGEELLEYVAVLRPRMKTICLSAVVDNVSLRGAVLALPKPFSLQAVAESVREVLAAALPEPAPERREATRRRAAGSPEA